jgi:hypothetical protein
MGKELFVRLRALGQLQGNLTSQEHYRRTPRRRD